MKKNIYRKGLFHAGTIKPSPNGGQEGCSKQQDGYFRVDAVVGGGGRMGNVR